jgi:hypothetical protein
VVKKNDVVTASGSPTLMRVKSVNGSQAGMRLPVEDRAVWCHFTLVGDAARHRSTPRDTPKGRTEGRIAGSALLIFNFASSCACVALVLMGRTANRGRACAAGHGLVELALVVRNFVGEYARGVSDGHSWCRCATKRV